MHTVLQCGPVSVKTIKKKYNPVHSTVGAL